MCTTRYAYQRHGIQLPEIRSDHTSQRVCTKLFVTSTPLHLKIYCVKNVSMKQPKTVITIIFIFRGFFAVFLWPSTFCKICLVSSLWFVRLKANVFKKFDTVQFLTHLALCQQPNDEWNPLEFVFFSCFCFHNFVLFHECFVFLDFHSEILNLVFSSQFTKQTFKKLFYEYFNVIFSVWERSSTLLHFVKIRFFFFTFCFFLPELLFSSLSIQKSFQNIWSAAR